MTDTILVVDDEPDLEDLVRQKFRRQIREGALTFLFARDGVEALEQVAAHDEIDMVVTDINMPRMDGLTLIERLAAAKRRLSTIIVSAYGDMANIRTAMNRGAFDFLTKPIDFGDFETTLRKTIAHVAALREARDKQAEAERAQAALARYFSPNLARSLAGDASALAGGRREIATLFTDIAGFTALVETLDTDVLSSLLGEYLTGMTEIVFEREGTVAKIIGDAIHVLFGAPADQPDAAARAIDCALALDDWSEDFRRVWRERGVAVGPTRIGVHAGPAIVGNFGGGRLFDYTAYGDTVNAASRLEAANKTLGIRICVSAVAVERAGAFIGRPVGDLLLRGRSEPLRAYEPFRTASTEGEAYLQAFAKLERKDPDAVAAFAALVGARPNDPLAQYHLRRLLNGASGVRIEIA